MRLQTFSEYIEHCGGAIYAIGSCNWFTHYPHRKWYLLSLSFWEPVTPSSQEINMLFRETEAYVLRFPSHTSLPFGNPSHLLVASGEYDLSSLHPKARNQTRRGLENFTVMPVSFERLAEEGYPAVLDTAQRQGVLPQKPDSFKHDCEIRARYSCWSTWGAYVDGRLAAFLVALQIQDRLVIMLERSVTDFLPLNPNNALVYRFTEWALSETKLQAVSFGMGALEGDEMQDHFKLRMGYKKIPISDVVIVRSPYGPLLQFIPSKFLSLLTMWARRKGNRNWVKALSLVRLAKCSIGYQH